MPPTVICIFFMFMITQKMAVKLYAIPTARIERYALRWLKIKQHTVHKWKAVSPSQLLK